MRPIVGGPWDGSWTRQTVEYFVVPVYEPLEWGPRSYIRDPAETISYNTFEYQLDILRQKDFNGDFPPMTAGGRDIVLYRPTDWTMMDVLTHLINRCTHDVRGELDDKNRR